MKYLKRKLYFLLCILLWLGILRSSAIVFCNSIAWLPDLPYSTQRELDLLYWLLPLWLIGILFWFMSPQKMLGGGNEKLTRKQKVMLAEALSKPSGKD